MKEGTVVTVSVKLDQRVRERATSTGTIISIHGQDITVLFEDGNIWMGTTKQAYLAQEQETPLKPKV